MKDYLDQSCVMMGHFSFGESLVQLLQTLSTCMYCFQPIPIFLLCILDSGCVFYCVHVCESLKVADGAMVPT